MEYQRDEHRVHLIVYHLVWCPTRRKLDQKLFRLHGGERFR